MMSGVMICGRLARRWVAVTALAMSVVSGLAWSDEVEVVSRDPADEIELYRDGKGLWRDTKYFLGYQVGAIAILYAMPESVSGWSAEQKKGYSFSVWWEKTTHPENDSDDFYINYILHPYWGAAYFVRARERGYNNWEAFGYSTLLSSLYEFGIEALFEEPSKQDLWVTPVIGSMVGMYFMHLRGNIRTRDIERGYRSTGDKWLWVLTDPLGSLNRQFDHWFGWDTEVALRPYRAQSKAETQGAAGPPGPEDRDYTYGLQLEVRW
jgi:hypothetical protein